MNKGLIFLPFASALEFLGILTLLTNPSFLIPEVDLGFQIPVFLISADVQGFSTLILGSLLSVYAVMNMDQA